MNRRLEQSRGILRIEAEILPGAVRYRERGVLHSHETVVPLHEVADEPTRFFHVNRLYLFICLFFALLLGMRLHAIVTRGDATRSVIFPIVWVAVAVLGTWMQSARYVGFRSSGGGLFFFDTRGKGDPTEFIEAIRRERAAYLGTGDAADERPHGFLVSRSPQSPSPSA